MKQTERHGWGRNFHTRNEILEVREILPRGLKSIGSTGLAVGLGRSYGDSSLNSEGVYWSSLSSKKITIDAKNKIATCEAGATIGDLETESLKFGLFPPVVPGTQFVTIGGAAASNIHGKSHSHYGSFGNHVTEIELLDSNLVSHLLYPEGETSDKFWATIGGMGLTGFIKSVRLKLIEVASPFFDVREQRANSIEEIFDLLIQFDKRYVYTVAWIDLSGNYIGRGIVSGGNHTHAKSMEVNQKFKSKLPKLSFRFSLPDIFSSKTINSFTVRVFNELWFRKPLKNGLVKFDKFLHPLDSINNWNRIYGKKGFIQYQFVVPIGHESLIIEFVSGLKNLKVASFMGILKKFGNEKNKFLSFPINGWTLAVDIPFETKGISEYLKYMDEKLCQVGGKVYLTKDSRLGESHFTRMYRSLPEWKLIKAQMDPKNYWKSEQGKRLNIC